MKGGPRPSARVGSNYGEARGTADGRDMVTLHARGRLGSLPSMGYARGGSLGRDARGRLRLPPRHSRKVEVRGRTRGGGYNMSNVLKIYG